MKMLGYLALMTQFGVIFVCLLVFLFCFVFAFFVLFLFFCFLFVFVLFALFSIHFFKFQIQITFKLVFYSIFLHDQLMRVGCYLNFNTVNTVC